MKSTASSSASGRTLASFWRRRAFEARFPGTHIRVFAWTENRSSGEWHTTEADGIALCFLPNVRRVVEYRNFYSIDISCDACKRIWQDRQR